MNLFQRRCCKWALTAQSRNMQPLRCAAEVEFFREDDKRVQMSEVHGGVNDRRGNVQTKNASKGKGGVTEPAEVIKRRADRTQFDG